MGSNYLMSLTEKQESSSTGALPTVSTSDWTHSLLHYLNETLSATGNTATFALWGNWPGARTAHYLVMEPPRTQGASPLNLTHVFQRFVCQVLVSQLPNEALPELCESISEIYEYYIKPSATPSRYELPPTKMPAKRGKTNPPPELRI